MHICLVYDCLYPWTIGGAERWYRALAEGLVAEEHQVTYLTRRQWTRANPPEIPGVRVVAVSPGSDLYRHGRRTIGAPLRFGAGVAVHLIRHGRRYDAVHIASFPYFSLLAVALVRPVRRYRVFVDWHEVWTARYWRAYLGPAKGWVGWRIQRWCLRLRLPAYCFSALHARRLRDEGHRARLTLLRGAYTGRLDPEPPVRARPYLLYAGRHIPEKRLTALIPALIEARRSLPDLRALLVGDGPERQQLADLVAAHDLAAVVDLPGFVDAATLADAMREALCVVLPSRREGYGMVVIEAAAFGTPSIVVRDPDNAATELIEEGVNGFVADSVSASDLASAILRVETAGMALRQSTAAWFARNVDRLSLAASLPIVIAAYADQRPPSAPPPVDARND